MTHTATLQIVAISNEIHHYHLITALYAMPRTQPQLELKLPLSPIRCYVLATKMAHYRKVEKFKKVIKIHVALIVTIDEVLHYATKEKQNYSIISKSY